MGPNSLFLLLNFLINAFSHLLLFRSKLRDSLGSFPEWLPVKQKNICLMIRLPYLGALA